MTCTAGIEFPLEDGEYELMNYDYPLCRYSCVVLKDGAVTMDGETFPLTALPATLERRFPVPTVTGGQGIETHRITLSIIGSER